MATATRGGATVLSLVGEIDIQTAPDLVNRFEELENQDVRQLVVDLSAVGFLDSSALGALIAAHRSITATGGSLSIACPRPHISKIFKLTRVAEVIAVYDSVDEAVAALA